jgi:lipoate-protein ligase A
VLALPWARRLNSAISEDKEKSVSMTPISKPFHSLLLWDDQVPRLPAEQMACDEALLRAEGSAVLRIYRWSGPTLTFGYAQHLREERRVAGDLPVMRRWTGGGVVFHGHDLTLGLAIPPREAAAAGTSAQIYRALHESLLAAIKKSTPTARLVTPEESRSGPVCFASPVRCDIVAGASKICGGALRRSRSGVLYQGSLHGGAASALEIASSLAEVVEILENTAPLEAATRQLAEEKYATPAWLELR